MRGKKAAEKRKALRVPPAAAASMTAVLTAVLCHLGVLAVPFGNVAMAIPSGCMRSSALQCSLTTR